MKRLLIPASVLIALQLAGCATYTKEPEVAPPPPPVIPVVPPDVLGCSRAPVVLPDTELDAGQVEKLWKTDRAALAKVNACLHRVVCQYQAVRSEIAQAPSVDCEPSKPKKRKPNWLSFLRKEKI